MLRVEEWVEAEKIGHTDLTERLGGILERDSVIWKL